MNPRRESTHDVSRLAPHGFIACGGRRCDRSLSPDQLFTSSIFEAVISFFPSASFTTPVTLICFGFSQMLSWKSLLTAFCARKYTCSLPPCFTVSALWHDSVLPSEHLAHSPVPTSVTSF